MTGPRPEVRAGDLAIRGLVVGLTLGTLGAILGWPGLQGIGLILAVLYLVGAVLTRLGH